MSVKSGFGKSTDLNTTEELQINETLLNKINKILSIVLEENEALENYKEKLSSQKNMSFTSYKKPSLSIKDYLYRIDRLCDISSILLTPYNIHRIIFVSILLAIKYNEDICFGFDFYAKIAGLPPGELKKLELEFAYLIKFKFFIDKDDFENYKSYIDDIESDENKL